MWSSVGIFSFRKIAIRIALVFVGMCLCVGYNIAAAQDIDCADDQTCKAQWSHLASYDENEFSEALNTLLRTDRGRVYKVLRAQSFDSSLTDRRRALMIAQTISQKRHKINPAQKSYDFWKAWYDASDTSDTEKIIPAYQMFRMFEKAKRNVDGAAKFIEDREKWRAITEKNPEGREGYLSVEHLTREINEKRAKTAELEPILEVLTAHVLENEAQTFDDYFRIFEAAHLLEGENVSEYAHFGALLFETILDTAIQTPQIWSDQFWTYIDDAPFSENAKIVRKLSELEMDIDRVKAFYIKRISFDEDMPKLMDTLFLILDNETLRRDSDIRKAVKISVAENPFTKLHILAELVSADAPPEYNPKLIEYGYREEALEILKAANSARTYCDAPSGEAPHYISDPPVLRSFSPKGYNYLGAPLMTIKTPSGYMTGHNRGEFGGGLVYYSGRNATGELLPLPYSGNIISVVQSNTEGIYWVLAGLNHLMPGKGTIYKLDARTDDVHVTPHLRMLSVPRDIKFFDSGDMFMDFRAKPYTTYDMTTGQTQRKRPEAQRYNPPVTLTRSGELKPACEF